MDEENKVEQTEQQTEQKQEQTEKTFTRDDVNRMIAAEKKKEREAAETDFQNKQAENEKLAKMKEDERISYEKKQAEDKANNAISELNAYKLKDEATKVANSEGLPLAFLDLIDFKSATAEQLNTTIGSLSKVFKSAVEQALNAKLQQKSPVSVQTTTTGTDFVTLLAKAQEENNMQLIAYYSRKIAEEKKK